MSLYCVYCRTGRAPRLVPQGFSFWAFLFGPLWLLAHAAFVPAILVLILLGQLGALLGPASAGVMLVCAFAIGLFGHDLCALSLRLRGFRLAHVVGGTDPDTAYARLLDTHPEYLQDARA